MADVDVKVALGEAPVFVAQAVEHLASCLGESHPSVAAGRRVMAELAKIPDDAVLVTEDSLATAIHRAWPFRRASGTTLTLSAASIIAALRTDSAQRPPAR